MMNCVCSNIQPEFFEELGTEMETGDLVRVRGIRCKRCLRKTYILKDVHVDFNRKHADEYLVNVWDKAMLKEILSGLKIKGASV